MCKRLRLESGIHFVLVSVVGGRDVDVDASVRGRTLLTLCDWRTQNVVNAVEW
jgi:hypothetical protein